MKQHRKPAREVVHHAAEATPAARSTRPNAKAAQLTAIEISARMVAQRRQLGAAFGTTAQRQQVAQEEELQMKRGISGVLQRLAPDEEEPLQGRFGMAQRKAAPEEEELLQGRFEPQVPAVAPQAHAAEPNRTGMPDNLKSGIESLSGLSMDHVRVHYNSAQPAQLNALAYAQGDDIHIAPGQEQHLPHEAWHVVQQAQGRVRPTMHLKDSVSVNDDAGLEAEADLMGARAGSKAQ